MKIIIPKASNQAETNITEEVDGTIDEIEKDIIDIYNIWYDKYIKIVQFIAIIGVGVFTITTGFVFDKFLKPDIKQMINHSDLSLLLVGLGIILLSVIVSFICILSAYRWFVIIIEKIKNCSTIDYNLIIKDRLYGKHKSGEIKIWGNLSLATGWACGFLLIAGLLIYATAVAKIILKIYQ